MCDEVPDDGWHERGDHDQHQDNNGTDDEAALGQAFFILVFDDQADIPQSILLSRSSRANHYCALLFWRVLF